MANEEALAETARIDEEVAQLKAQLRAFEDKIHSDLMLQPKPNVNRIHGIEKQIRAIVLRLVALERERIDATIAAAS